MLCRLSMEDREFRKHAEEALTALYHLLAAAADDYGFRLSHEGGRLTVEIDGPSAKLEVYPHKQTQQMWISTGRKHYKLDWDIVEATFILAATGESLREAMEEVLSQHVGEDLSL